MNDRRVFRVGDTTTVVAAQQKRRDMRALQQTVDARRRERGEVRVATWLPADVGLRLQCVREAYDLTIAEAVRYLLDEAGF